MRQSVIEPARTLPTWDDLLSVAPELLRFEQEAGEAAGNRFPDWLVWVEHFGTFRAIVHQAAQATGSDFGSIMRVVTGRLTDSYDSAQRRLQRRRNA